MLMLLVSSALVKIISSDIEVFDPVSLQMTAVANNLMLMVWTLVLASQEEQIHSVKVPSPDML